MSDGEQPSSDLAFAGAVPLKAGERLSESNYIGFYTPDEALRILSDATDLARQAQMKASQATDDPSLLKTSIYGSINPKPTLAF